MMQRHRMMMEQTDDWFLPENRGQLLIIVGMDVTPFEEAIRNDIQTTVILSAVMILLGFGGFISLFWLNSYRDARRSLHDTSVFANEVVGHLPVGLVATDRSGKVSFFNAAAEQITGLDSRLLYNRKPDAFLPEGLCGLQKELDQGEVVTEREMDCSFAPGKTIPVIIMTAYSSVDSAVEAIKSGAYDYLIKPLDFEILKLTIERAGEHAGLKEENRVLKEHLLSDYDPANIIGRSHAMKKLLEMMSMVAPSEATVLIAGDSGTGKELIARSLHFNSPRKKQPLVVVNCAAMAEALLESELFGHEKGSFTGADKRREGRFMQANRGTIFLDEIGETSSTMQVKLLRVLQEKEIQRVGGEETLKVDIRIVAATNRNLEKEVAEGNFREDLFYRLNVMTLAVPPLKERRDDIPLLAQHFLKKFADKNRKTIKGLVPLAMDMLINYDWPGNVRELENALERAVFLATGEHITEAQLPLNITEPHSKQAEDGERRSMEAAQILDGTHSLDDIEKEAILAALNASSGNKAEAARRLGGTRKTLHNKLNSYGLGKK